MPPSAPLAVSATGLVKQFKDFRAVDGIDLEVARGEVFGVLGPNGAGKTTTLRMLATLLTIDEGHAEIFGHDVAAEPHVVRQLIGVTGQYASVDEELTAHENLTMFGRLSGLSGRDARARSAELLERFGLQEATDRALSKFSGGMRRRLDLAVSLITQPPLIFLDEPTTGLDPRTRGQMWDTIRELVRGGATILLTTQYLDEADQLADRIAVIDSGRRVALGTPDSLKSQVGDATLTLTLTDVADTERAREVLGRVIEEQVQTSPEARRLTVGLPRADAAAEALHELHVAGVSVEEIAVTKPSLDEVFLALTGRSDAGDAA